MPDPTPSTRRVAFATLALCALITLLVAWDMPGRGLSVSVLVALATIALGEVGRHAPRAGALAALVGLTPLYLWLHRWMVDVTLPGMIGLSIGIAAHTGVFVWLAARLRARCAHRWRYAIAAALLLATVDFFRGRIALTGYPWFLTGERAIDHPLGVALAPLVGMYGVNLAVCLLGGVAFALVLTLVERRAAKRPPLGAGVAIVLLAAIVVLPVGLGAPAPVDDARAVTVAIVQTNVPQSNKQSASLDDRIAQFADAARLTREAHAQALERFGAPPTVIVWPETMVPVAALNDDAVRALRDAPAAGFAISADMRDALLALQESLGAPMLVGAMALHNPRVVEADEPGYVRLAHDGAYNSAFLVSGGRVSAERYDKAHLTPFGEVMPLISRSEWLEQRLLALGAPGMSFDLVAGRNPVRFDLDGVRLAAPICFEATIPLVCRRLAFDHAERRADVLVNLTNDGWFGRVDDGRRNHLRLARWRAAELATPVVRAANTGISCVIDAKGRVREAAPARTGAVLLARVEPGSGSTLYARTGDALGWAGFVAGLAVAVAAALPRRSTPATHESGANPDAPSTAQHPIP